MNVSEIRSALELGEFELQFRPRVALCDGRVDSLEAVLRWHHPRLGVLTPSAFSAEVESRALGAELAWQIVADALTAMRLWAGCGFVPRVWLPLPRNAVAVRAHMADFAALNGVDGGRLLCMDAPQVLTIDAALVADAAESPNAEDKLALLLRKAHEAGMVTTAQGVSNLLDWLVLRELGCDYASGEFIAPHRLAHGVPDVLRIWREQHAAMSAVDQYL